jgi:hypothetical protein
VSKKADSFTDRHGRTWPGKTTLNGAEVTAVDVAGKRIQIRTSGTTFHWLDPDELEPTTRKKAEKPEGKDK